MSIGGDQRGRNVVAAEAGLEAGSDAQAPIETTGRLAATFVAAGCGLSGTGSASAPDCAGAAVGGTGAVTGSVVGETMLGGDGVSALPEVLGTWASGSWASGSEIGMPDSSDPPQGVEAGV